MPELASAHDDAARIEVPEFAVGESGINSDRAVDADDSSAGDVTVPGASDSPCARKTEAAAPDADVIVSPATMLNPMTADAEVETVGLSLMRALPAPRKIEVHVRAVHANQPRR